MAGELPTKNPNYWLGRDGRPHTRMPFDVNMGVRLPHDGGSAQITTGQNQRESTTPTPREISHRDLKWVEYTGKDYLLAFPADKHPQVTQIDQNTVHIDTGEVTDMVFGRESDDSTTKQPEFRLAAHVQDAFGEDGVLRFLDEGHVTTLTATGGLVSIETPDNKPVTQYIDELVIEEGANVFVNGVHMHSLTEEWVEEGVPATDSMLATSGLEVDLMSHGLPHDRERAAALVELLTSDLLVRDRVTETAGDGGTVLEPLSPRHTLFLDKTYPWLTEYAHDGSNFDVIQEEGAPDNVTVTRVGDRLVIDGEGIQSLLLGKKHDTTAEKPLIFEVSDADKISLKEGHTVRINGKVGSVFGDNGTVIVEKGAVVEEISDKLTVQREVGENVVTEFEEVKGLLDGLVIWRPKDGSGFQIIRPEGTPQPVVLEREGGYVIELQGKDTFPMIQAKGATVTIRDVDNPKHKTGALNDNIYFDLSEKTAHDNTLKRPEVTITNGRVRVEDGNIIIDHAETVAAEGYRRGNTLQTAEIVVHEKTFIQNLLLDGLANVSGPMNSDAKKYVRDMKLVGSNSWNGALLRRGWVSQESLSKRVVEPVAFFPGYKEGVRQPLPRIVEDVTHNDGSRTVTFEPGFLGSLSILEGTKVVAPGVEVQDVRINGGQTELSEVLGTVDITEGSLGIDHVSGNLTIKGNEAAKGIITIGDIKADSVVTVSGAIVDVTGENNGVVALENDSSLNLSSGNYRILSYTNKNITVNGRKGQMDGTWVVGTYGVQK